MKVVEKFVSINGEGMKSGELSAFIRFYGCNLNCSYCDSQYANTCNNYTEESVESILDWIKEKGIKNITITGGEPFYQNTMELKSLVSALMKDGHEVEIETNGSYDFRNFLNLFLLSELGNLHFTIDYKLPSSGQEEKMINPSFLAISHHDTYKFVIGSQEDLNRAYDIVKKYNLHKIMNVIFSPVFGEIDPEEIVDFMKEKKLNDIKFQLQIHKFIWDPNTQGV